MVMADKAALLNELYQAKLEDLKQIAITYNLPKNGSVEHLRARLIRDLILEDWDFSDSGIREIKNAELGRNPWCIRHQKIRVNKS